MAGFLQGYACVFVRNGAYVCVSVSVEEEKEEQKTIKEEETKTE